MKKNKLYTVNRWNQPAFMVDRQRHNIFDGFTLGQSNQMNSNPFGVSFNAPTVSTPKIDWSNPVQRNMALGQTKGLTSSFSSGNPINLQQSNQMLSNNISGKTSSGLFKTLGNAAIGGLAGMGTGIVLDVAGKAANAIGNGIGNALAGRKTSGVGSAVKTVGDTLGGIVEGVPIFGGAASGLLKGATGLISGGINALVGQSVDEEALKDANEGTAAYNNFQSNATSFDAITGPVAQANVKDVYEDGLLGGDADEKNEALRQERRDARQLAFRSVDNNIFNLQNDQLNNALANYSAFGGPIETGDMGAIDYGFMSGYLTQKKRENDMKSKMAGIPSMPAFMPNSFAIGGDLQTNGGNYSVGKVYDVSEREANRLKAMGYEFTVIG